MSAEISSKQTELYIIKCMYNSPASIVEIVQNVRKQDFSNTTYRSLFDAIRNTSIDGNTSAESIMTFLVNNNLEAYDEFKRVGGARKIEQVLRDNTLRDNPSVTEQIKELKKLTYRRNALQTMEKLKECVIQNIDVDSQEEFENVEDIDNKIKESIYSLAENISTDTKVSNIGNAVDQLRMDIKAGDTMGIDISSIGYPKLNKLIKRLRDGALYIFGAPEKTGKSTFMLDIGWKIADELDIPVAYADTEMTTPETLLRICSKLSGIEEDRIADNILNEKEQKIVDAVWFHIKEVPFYHFNANLLTNAELESQVKLLQMKYGIQLFIYDYIKVQSAEVEKGRPDLILAGKLDTLKEKICKSCNIPVITSGQMYKKDDERGQQNRFAETSHFTKLGDVICRLDRCDPNNPEEMGTHYIELITGRKVRSDMIGKKIYMNFDMPVHKIFEL